MNGIHVCIYLSCLVYISVSGLKLYDSCFEHSQCPMHSTCRSYDCKGYSCLCDEGYVATDDKTSCLKARLIGETCKYDKTICMSPFAFCIVGHCECMGVFQTTEDGRCKLPGMGFTGDKCSELLPCHPPAACRNDKCVCEDPYRHLTPEEFWIDPMHPRQCVTDNYALDKCNGSAVFIPLTLRPTSKTSTATDSPTTTTTTAASTTLPTTTTVATSTTLPTTTTVATSTTTLPTTSLATSTRPPTTTTVATSTTLPRTTTVATSTTLPTTTSLATSATLLTTTTTATSTRSTTVSTTTEESTTKTSEPTTSRPTEVERLKTTSVPLSTDTTLSDMNTTKGTLKKTKPTDVWSQVTKMNTPNKSQISTSGLNNKTGLGTLKDKNFSAILKTGSNILKKNMLRQRFKPPKVPQLRNHRIVNNTEHSSSNGTKTDFNDIPVDIAITPSSSWHQMRTPLKTDRTLNYKNKQTDTKELSRDSVLYTSIVHLETSMYPSSSKFVPEMYTPIEASSQQWMLSSDILYKTSVTSSVSYVGRNMMSDIAWIDNLQYNAVTSSLPGDSDNNHMLHVQATTVMSSASVTSDYKNINPAASVQLAPSVKTESYTELTSPKRTNSQTNENISVSQAKKNVLDKAFIKGSDKSGDNRRFFRPIIHISTKTKITKSVDSENLVLNHHRLTNIINKQPSAGEGTIKSGKSDLQATTTEPVRTIKTSRTPIFFSKRPIIAITLFDIGRDLYSTCTKHSQCPEHSKCRPNACEGYLCLCKDGYIASDDRKFCLKAIRNGEKCDPRTDKCISKFSMCAGVCKCLDFFEHTRDGRCKLPNAGYVGDDCSKRGCQYPSTCVREKCKCKHPFRDLSAEEFWVSPQSTLQCRTHDYSLDKCNGSLIEVPEEMRKDLESANIPPENDKVELSFRNLRPKSSQNGNVKTDIAKELLSTMNSGNVVMYSSSYKARPFLKSYEEIGISYSDRVMYVTSDALNHKGSTNTYLPILRNGIGTSDYTKGSILSSSHLLTILHSKDTEQIMTIHDSLMPTLPLTLSLYSTYSGSVVTGDVIKVSTLPSITSYIIHNRPEVTRDAKQISTSPLITSLNPIYTTPVVTGSIGHISTSPLITSIYPTSIGPVVTEDDSVMPTPFLKTSQHATYTGPVVTGDTHKMSASNFIASLHSIYTTPVVYGDIPYISTSPLITSIYATSSGPVVTEDDGVVPTRLLKSSQLETYTGPLVAGDTKKISASNFITSLHSIYTTPVVYGDINNISTSPLITSIYATSIGPVVTEDDGVVLTRPLTSSKHETYTGPLVADDTKKMSALNFITSLHSIYTMPVVYGDINNISTSLLITTKYATSIGPVVTEDDGVVPTRLVTSGKHATYTGPVVTGDTNKMSASNFMTNLHLIYTSPVVYGVINNISTSPLITSIYATFIGPVVTEDNGVMPTSFLTTSLYSIYDGPAVTGDSNKIYTSNLIKSVHSIYTGPVEAEDGNEILTSHIITNLDSTNNGTVVTEDANKTSTLNLITSLQSIYTGPVVTEVANKIATSHFIMSLHSTHTGPLVNGGAHKTPATTVITSLQSTHAGPVVIEDTNKMSTSNFITGLYSTNTGPVVTRDANKMSTSNSIRNLHSLHSEPIVTIDYNILYPSQPVVSLHSNVMDSLQYSIGYSDEIASNNFDGYLEHLSANWTTTEVMSVYSPLPTIITTLSNDIHHQTGSFLTFMARKSNIYNSHGSKLINVIEHVEGNTHGEAPMPLSNTFFSTSAVHHPEASLYEYHEESFSNTVYSSFSNQDPIVKLYNSHNKTQVDKTQVSLYSISTSKAMLDDFSNYYDRQLSADEIHTSIETISYDNKVVDINITDLTKILMDDIETSSWNSSTGKLSENVLRDLGETDQTQGTNIILYHDLVNTDKTFPSEPKEDDIKYLSNIERYLPHGYADETPISFLRLQTNPVGYTFIDSTLSFPIQSSFQQHDNQFNSEIVRIVPSQISANKIDHRALSRNTLFNDADLLSNVYDTSSKNAESRQFNYLYSSLTPSHSLETLIDLTTKISNETVHLQDHFIPITTIISLGQNYTISKRPITYTEANNNETVLQRNTYSINQNNTNSESKRNIEHSTYTNVGTSRLNYKRIETIINNLSDNIIKTSLNTYTSNIVETGNQQNKYKSPLLSLDANLFYLTEVTKSHDPQLMNHGQFLGPKTTVVNKTSIQWYPIQHSISNTWYAFRPSINVLNEDHVTRLRTSSEYEVAPILQTELTKLKASDNRIHSSVVSDEIQLLLTNTQNEYRQVFDSIASYMETTILLKDAASVHDLIQMRHTPMPQSPTLHQSQTVNVLPENTNIGTLHITSVKGSEVATTTNEYSPPKLPEADFPGEKPYQTEEKKGFDQLILPLAIVGVFLVNVIAAVIVLVCRRRRRRPGPPRNPIEAKKKKMAAEQQQQQQQKKKRFTIPRPTVYPPDYTNVIDNSSSDSSTYYNYINTGFSTFTDDSPYEEIDKKVLRGSL